jgi:hypothetical protein
LRPLEIAKAASGIANQLGPEQFQPRWMLQQPKAGRSFSLRKFVAERLNFHYRN